VAEIGAVNARAAGAFEGQQQVAGSTAQVDRTRLGIREYVAYARHRAIAPAPVEVEREQVIGQIVAVRHAGEHAAHPTGRLLLAGSAARGGAGHRSAARTASSTRAESTSDTTATCPMPVARTK